MKISRIDIHYFKGIDELHLEIQPGFNLLVGENGKGKTSILEAIAVGLGGFVSGIPTASARHFSQNEIRKIYFPSGDGSCYAKTFLPIEVELEAEVDGLFFKWKRARMSEKESRSTIQPRDITKYATNLCYSNDSELPILLYESTARLWNQRRATKNNRISDRYDRTKGYSDALKEASNQKLLIDWCIKMEMASFKTHKRIDEYEAVKLLVSKFMSMMNGQKDNEHFGNRIFFDAQMWEMMFEENGKVLPVSSLSAGYQSLIWMVFDFAYRMAILNPHLGENIGQTKGIILIDELDMHLHPKWQWNVINSLKSVFPNVQFIATTHAPILIAAANDVNIIDLNGNYAKSRYSEYGLDVNTAIESYLNTTIYPPEIQTSITDIFHYFDDGDIDQAERSIVLLRSKLGDGNPLVTKLKTRLELERFNWEK